MHFLWSIFYTNQMNEIWEMRLTGEPVLVSVPLRYAWFLRKVDVCRAWNRRQFLQELHTCIYIYIWQHNEIHKIIILSYYNSHYKLKSDGNIEALHLKLLLKTCALCSWVLFLQISDDCLQFMGNHSSVSTAQVVIEGIMDEGILVLYGKITLLLMTNLELYCIHSDVNARKVVTGMHVLI